MMNLKNRGVFLLSFIFILPLYVQQVCSQEQESVVPFSLTISEQLRSTFTLVGSGARAAGMGGAFTAVADDATAASFNPGGLAQLVVAEGSVVMDHVNLKDEYRDFFLIDPDLGPLPLTDSEVQFSRNDFNFLSFTIPFQMLNRRWSVQFSSQKAVDLTYQGDRRFFELDEMRVPQTDFHQRNDQSGGIRLYSGSLAISATQRMLLGVTLNRWDGDWEFIGLNSETPVDDPEAAEFLTYMQRNALSGWNFDLGMLLRYKYGNVGVRYRSAFTADYRLEAEVETNINEEVKPLPDLNTTLKWPSTLNIGVALKPSQSLTLAVDYGRTNWSRMLFEIPDESGRDLEVNFFDLKSPDATLVRTATDWRFGAEYLFFFRTAVVPVRAGWFYEPRPGVDAFTGSRMISRGFTVGMGIKIDWLAIDFAYQRRYSTTSITLYEPDDIIIGDVSNPTVGDLRRSESRLFFSSILQVPKDSFLERLIRVVFVRPEADRE